MALNPFADYFNHSSPPTCTATYSSAGFEIGAVRSAKKGEEVYISYGAHSNDFLLTEYGFVMDENENDSVSLDDVVMAKLVEGGKEEQVKDAGFWGKYTLDKEGVCYRTQVALRSLIMTERRWERFVSGADEGRDEEGKYVELLQGILLELQDSVTETIYELNKLETDEKEARGTLVRRWKQIIGLLNHVFESTIR